MSMKVELLVFSGRPNPVWDLSSADEAAFKAKIAGLSQMTSRPTSPDGLGYAGFTVRDGDACWYVAYRGQIAIAGPPNLLADPNREIENFLKGTAGNAVDQAVWAGVSFT